MTDIHDRGLQFDLATLLHRRRALSLLSGAALTTLVACSSPTTTSSGTSTTTGSSSEADCSSPIPEETQGPFPGDGSNGPNVLTQSGIVRSDIRTSFGSGSATAEGVPLTLSMTVLDTGKACAPYAGAAVYVWQCDIDGRYSMYTQGITNENYLRGVQEADTQGKVTFKTVFPGCYTGRWPHVHFEVYPTLAEATKAGNIIATSQLAFPETTCKEVYGTTGYTTSVKSMARLSLTSDMVFRDSHERQLAGMSGDVNSGYTATLSVPV